MRNVRPSILVLTLLTAAAPPASGSGADSCADGHIGLRWGAFREPLTSSYDPPFYFGAEGESNVTITVEGVGHECTAAPEPVTGTYEVRDYPQEVPAPATSILDYQPVTGSTGPINGRGHGPPPTEHSQVIPITQDPLVEAVAEQAQAIITFSSGRVDEPWDVPLQIIDDDGLSRVAFHSDERREHSETFPTLFVAVLRAGPADAAESFPFTVEGSSVYPAGPEDFEVVTPDPLEFGAGERIELIELAVVNDTVAELSEELTITLTDPGTLLPDDAATVGIRILDNEEGEGGGVPPASRFHHPRHGVRYERGDYRLREFHVFATDEDGDVAAVELALRQRQASGRCAWYTGKRFARGACASKRWLATEYYPDLDWYYYRVGKLPPSVGTSITSYTAFARAIDGAGNVEGKLQTGRNANTFEVDSR